MTAKIIYRIQIGRRSNYHIDTRIAYTKFPCVTQRNITMTPRRIRKQPSSNLLN